MRICILVSEFTPTSSIWSRFHKNNKKAFIFVGFFLIHGYKMENDQRQTLVIRFSTNPWSLRLKKFSKAAKVNLNAIASNYHQI